MRNESLDSIANIRMYGMLVMNDYDPYLEDSSHLMAYYTMPFNQMTLLTYINS